MASESVVKLCQAELSVSAEVAKDSKIAPTEICQRLYSHNVAVSPSARKESSNDGGKREASEHELERARQCGQWGPTQPSDLFLYAFSDALACLDHDPLASMVSPSLISSYGTSPLAIIAPLADLVRHTSNLIVRAQREVLLASCSWSPSLGLRLIHNAMIELSKRAGARKERVIVKIIFDKTGPAHAFSARQHLKASECSSEAVGLPKPEEIPNLDLEVMSFHKVLLGTLHAKFMVVDRKIAVVQSNNMEDNDNLEMLVQVEGPIVESIYDTFLITWGDALCPSLPSINDSATHGGLDGVGHTYTDRGGARDQQQVSYDGEAAWLPEHTAEDPHYDDDLASEITRMQSAYASKPNESHLEAISRLLNLAAHTNASPTAPPISPDQRFTPYIPISATSPCPIALVSRPPYGAPNNSNIFIPQNEAWLSLIRYADRDIFIQTPDLNATPLYTAIASALQRGVEITYYVCLGYNDAGEMMPGQGGTNEMFASKLCSTLSSQERKNLHIHYYVAKDQNKPIHHSKRSRSCHIKLLIADGKVGVQGSGNMDTQSWCHSQEINLMVDSEEVCRKWREGIERNQNTALYGRAGQDGLWRDEHGREAEGATGMPSTLGGYVKGAIGMFKKARESGHAHA